MNFCKPHGKSGKSGEGERGTHGENKRLIQRRGGRRYNTRTTDPKHSGRADKQAKTQRHGDTGISRERGLSLGSNMSMNFVKARHTPRHGFAESEFLLVTVSVILAFVGLITAKQPTVAGTSRSFRALCVF